MLASVWQDLKESLLPGTAFAETEVEEDKKDQATVDDGDADPSDEAQADKDADEDAEAEKDEQTEEAQGDEGNDDAAEDADEGKDEDDEEEEEDEDDEDDDDEIQDPMETLREQFSETVCHDFKHHFDECVERVTAEQEEPDYADKEYKEDCVEEFFHYRHCLDDKIAPILFSKLK